MAITQVDTENADRDLTSQVTVLTDTPDASNNVICQALIMFGDGTKNLDGTGGDFELEISVAGNTVQPAPQVVTFGTDVRASVWTTAFPVPANTEVVIKATSPNAADTDVDVTAYLYDVSAPSAAAVLAAFGTGSTLSSCATATGFSTHSAADVYTAFGDGSNLSTCATATGFSTHDAADVVTAIGTGSTLTACITATGFSTHSAADVWSAGTRTLSAFGFDVTLANGAHGGAAATLVLSDYSSFLATGFSTHSAADVYTAFGTGSDLTACITAVGFSTHAAADVWAVGTRILTASTNFNDLSAANVTTACTSSLNSYDPPTKGEMDTMEVNLTAEIDANETKIDIIDTNVDALTLGSGYILSTTVSASDSTTSFTVTAGKESADAHNGALIQVTDADDANTEIRRVQDWTAGRVVTVDRAFSFTPAVDDVVKLLSYSQEDTGVGTGPTLNTYTVTDADTTDPIEGATVYMSISATESDAKIYKTTTDAAGKAYFYPNLASGTTVYMYTYASGHSFTNPDTEVLA